ncbi:MAG: hypothetical protein EU536_03635 [Promethearchaeota archaeon]|nr:MAG: hypothetical protein EU536_03635 [Candidatus Lokiarchaeota archaeon]
MPSQENESTINSESSDIETIRAQVSKLSSNYISTFTKFPLIKIEGITDLKEIINKNVNFEIETRKLQKKLNRYLKLLNDMLEAGINASVLHQHFLGCIDIALQCQDYLCIKIFLSQAHSTFNEIIRYIKQYLNLSRDIEKFTKEVDSLLNFVHPSIDFSERFLQLEENLMDTMETTIVKLEKLIEE